MVLRSRQRRAPQPLLLPPQVLHNRYALELPGIGEGGCAIVYRAWDAHQGRPVAIKRAHHDPIAHRLLAHEAELLAHLQHPAFPTLIEVYQEGGQLSLIEEWRVGTPRKHCSLEEVIRLGLRCWEALDYLHSRGIVHRDLKPEHVLVEGEAITLLDLSIACWRDDPPLCAGSGAYAAPEQRTGAIDPASDVYGLGMLLGCWLTDEDPFAVVSAGSFTGLWEDPTTIPSEERPLLALLDQMLTQTPGARPALAQVGAELRCLARALLAEK